MNETITNETNTHKRDEHRTNEGRYDALNTQHATKEMHQQITTDNKHTRTLTQ